MIEDGMRLSVLLCRSHVHVHLPRWSTYSTKDCFRERERERERETVFHDCSWSWWLQLKLIIRQVLITKISEWRFGRTWVLFNVSFSVLQTTWNIYPLMLQSLCQSLFSHCFSFALFVLIVTPPPPPSLSLSLSLSLLNLMQRLSICH